MRRPFVPETMGLSEPVTPIGSRIATASVAQRFQAPWNPQAAMLDPNVTTRATIDQVRSSVEEIQKATAATQQQIAQLRQSQAVLEREFPDILRQLDLLASQLEREKGDVAVLKEQLAFLAAGNRSSAARANGQSRVTGTESTSSVLRGLLISIARNLYNPLLSFISGVYIILWPILVTFQCLSLFGSQDELPSEDNTGSNSTTGGLMQGCDDPLGPYASDRTPAPSSAVNRNQREGHGNLHPSSGRNTVVLGASLRRDPQASQRGSEMLALLRQTAAKSR